jgi:hypothetical protein
MRLTIGVDGLDQGLEEWVRLDTARVELLSRQIQKGVILAGRGVG